MNIRQTSYDSNNIQIGSCNVIKNSCICNGVVVHNNKVIINGEELPPVPSGKIHSSTIIDNKVYINGYEWKDGEWQRTLKALWHNWF